MKLRIKGNSLRLRLLKSEVKQLDESGEVTEIVRFGPQRTLSYSLVAVEDAPEISAVFEEASIRVRVPRRVAHEWALSDQIGLTAEQSVMDGEPLRLLIEKDLMCLKPRTSGQMEDESDAFPNPNPTCGHPA